MKAYAISDGECGKIIFAPDDATRGQVRSIAFDLRECDEVDYIDLTVRRLARADKYYRGHAEMNRSYLGEDARAYRRLRWYLLEWDDACCAVCGLYENDLPEGRIDEDGICVECLAIGAAIGLGAIP